MFILYECILFLFIIFTESSLLKYLSICLCFGYLLYHHILDKKLLIILIADILLLFTHYEALGIFLFMSVQVLYHYEMRQHDYFYCFMLGGLFFQIYILSFLYAFMSIINMITAYKQKHWLFNTLILLFMCDVCVGLQYMLHSSIPLIWIFYLPSQVYYTKKVLSMKIKPL